ncbi:hypothetical protein ACFQ78_28280 [Streptomyces sp. NPDC056519]
MPYVLLGLKADVDPQQPRQVVVPEGTLLRVVQAGQVTIGSQERPINV